MNCVTVTFALLAYAVRQHLVPCARAHTSQITCVAGHYKGWGSWKCSCKSTSAGLFPGRMEAFPLQHPELCITLLLQNCVSLLNQSLGKAEARWLASWLIKARRLWGLAFQFIPKCDTLGRGDPGSGFTGCGFRGGKPGAYLCLFVFWCCRVPSSHMSLFY